MCPLKRCLFFASFAVLQAKIVYEKRGEVNVAVVLKRNCEVSEIVDRSDITTVNSIIWANQRINFVHVTNPLTFGVTVYETCSANEDYRVVFENFLANDSMGFIVNFQLDNHMKKVFNALSVDVRPLFRWYQPLLKSAAKLVNALQWDEVTVVAEERDILSEFLQITLETPVCIKDFIIIKEKDSDCLRNLKGNFLIFGESTKLLTILQNFNHTLESNLVLAPLDGITLNDIPENSYLILPPASPVQHIDASEVNFYPSPRILQVSIPLVSFAYSIQRLIKRECNDTVDKLRCVKEAKSRFLIPIEPKEMVRLLKIEPLSSNFAYHTFHFENSTHNKVFAYGIFNDSLSLPNGSFYGTKTAEYCKFSPMITIDSMIKLRTESWVFAFLSLSLLGILVCVAILAFLGVCICRHEILEGNPLLSIVLLLSVITLYLCVIPLVLDSDDSSIRKIIYLLRTLGPTCTFACTFALILSRCILLATASKELGFMSHVSGSVQTFLCFFIFGVQIALCLQIYHRLEVTYFILPISYDFFLLFLLLCLGPVVYKSQRNYREGKYFTLAAAFITICWLVWVPSYLVLTDDYRDVALCCGLVSTASVLIGTVFVPRTYLISIAAARNKITGTLPSCMATGASAMDLYRAGPQPVYDCINVAAINAVAAARIGLGGATINTDDDEEFNFTCDTPPENDKVTRF